MNPYTVILHIYNEEIRAIVQVLAQGPYDAENEAFKRIYNYDAFELQCPEVDGVYAPSSSHETLVLEGHGEILVSGEYNVFELNVLEKLAAIEEEP